MTGQLASTSVFSLELVAIIVGISMIAGTVDLVRQPGWAWKSAQESKIAYLVLVLLLPLVGLGMYLFAARPKVVEIAGAGRAASLPFERFGEEPRPAAAAPTTTGLGSFGEVFDTSLLADGVPAMEAVAVGAGATFFSTGGGSGGGGTAVATARPHLGLARQYRPKQRANLPTAVPSARTVPAGWKADPTGRHQFRYWDGTHWTENVADRGVQAKDMISS